MKKSRFTEEQIIYALQSAESGAPLADPSRRSCGLKANARNLFHQMDST